MESLVRGMLSNAMTVTVLAVLVAVLGRACRRPALIHSLCLVAILKLVTPPIVPLAMRLPSSWQPSASLVPVPVVDEVGGTGLDFDAETEMKAAGVLADLGGIDESRPPDEPTRGDRLGAAAPPAAWRWEPTVLGVMLAGALAWWSLAVVRIVRFHRVLRDVEPMPAEWQVRIGELAGRLTLRRPPVVCMVPGEVPPMLWAVGLRPRLLVPRQLWGTLDEEQRRALVLHELAHLKRRDHWVRWIELVIAGLYWWHPAVWWLRRALREAEEQCCDAWVVWAMPRGARTYATALVAALEYVSGARNVPAVASVAASATIGNGHVSSLKRRLRMIVRAKTPKGLSLVGRFAVVGLAALLLPLAPSWAQKDKTESPLAEDPSKLVKPRAKQTEHAVLLALQKSDDKDAKAKANNGRDVAERIEKQLKELVDKLGKDASPVGQEVRKALERSVGEIHRALEKEGMTADELRRSVEKSQEELRKSFEPGGPVQKEMRESMERARKEMHESMERGRQEAERFREVMHRQIQEGREQLRKKAAEDREQQQKGGEALRKLAEPTQRQERRSRAEREPIKSREMLKAETKPDAADRSNRVELDAARKQIRDLQQQLESATRRLNELQRRDSRRGETPARAAEPRRPEPAARPAEPARPATPARAAEPRRPEPAARLARPAPDREDLQPARDRDDNDRRFRELEEKMNRLLKELEELKGRKTSAIRTPVLS
jgi:beta-lactamase regulating signal transducer with metallopeptidase domain